MIARDLRCTRLGVGDVVRAIEESTGEWGEVMAAREQEEEIRVKQYRYQCKLCGEKTQTKEGLTNHTRSKHGREPIVEGEEGQKRELRCGGGCYFIAKSSAGLINHRKGAQCKRNKGEGEHETVGKGAKKGKMDLVCGEGCSFTAKSKAGLVSHRGGRQCTRSWKTGGEEATAVLLVENGINIVPKGNRPRREVYQTGKYYKLEYDTEE